MLTTTLLHQPIVVLCCRAARWQVPSPVPGITIGDLLLEVRSFHHSKVWIWTSFAYIAGAIVITNLAIIACLAWLKGVVRLLI
jgi:Plant PDR ABC transporter associated